MNLTVSDIVDLLEFIPSTTGFKFQDQLYEQRFDKPMGSLVSPVLGNLYMEFIEQKAIATAETRIKPKIWCRYMYMDDVFEIIPKGKANLLTEHINKVDPTGNIKFM